MPREARETDLPKQIELLLKEKLLMPVESPDFDLVEAGLIDSLVFTQLFMELVANFGFDAPLEEMHVEDFRSVNSISRVVTEHAHAGEPA